MESKSFNVVICPPKEISQKSTEISSCLRDEGGLFVLDNKNYYPHISIYMTEFPVKNIPEIRKILREFSTTVKPFRLMSLEYRQSKDGFIDVDYIKSNEVVDLQNKIISLLNPLREGLIRPKDKARLSEMGENQQSNINQYGYRGVGLDFFPHITFTKLDKFSDSALQKIKRDDFSFDVGQLGFFYLGDYGTCVEQIETFNFS
jgi:2'-5' RNA ligase